MDDFPPEKIPNQQENNRDEITGRFKPGFTGNPNGRPKGSSMKEFWRRKFYAMTDEEKEAWCIENKVSAESIWKMSEGNPKQDTSVDLDANVYGPGIFRIDE